MPCEKSWWNSRRMTSASATSVTWNSSKQSSAADWAMSCARAGTGSPAPGFACRCSCSRLWISSMNSWKWTRRFFSLGRSTQSKKVSMMSDLPQPTPPYMYSPSGAATSSRDCAVAVPPPPLSPPAPPSPPPPLSTPLPPSPPPPASAPPPAPPPAPSPPPPPPSPPLPPPPPPACALSLSSHSTSLAQLSSRSLSLASFATTRVLEMLPALPRTDSAPERRGSAGERRPRGERKERRPRGVALGSGGGVAATSSHRRSSGASPRPIETGDSPVRTAGGGGIGPSPAIHE
mmetsp:Transcript_15312/g.50923  ORF Transcript_15312/g.50923 Transcript_15312/m.50923 type:complete len:290 (-) Transcript_15312:42-911(-)